MCVYPEESGFAEIKSDRFLVSRMITKMFRFVIILFLISHHSVVFRIIIKVPRELRLEDCTVYNPQRLHVDM